MDWNSIILAVIAAISGGALGSVLTFKLGKRKQDESEFSTVISEYKELVEGYKEEVLELRKEIDEVRNLLNKKDFEIINLRKRLSKFEKENNC